MSLNGRPYDVAVIGAGVVGAAVAWRLSHERLRVLWLEAEHDVAEGASKANSAIACSGFDTPPGTLETSLVRSSSTGWERLCAQLDVPFRRIGALVLGLGEEDDPLLEQAAERAKANGVAAELIDGQEARRLLAGAAPRARRALHVPDEGIIDPLRLTLGFAEAAVRGGVELRLSSPVIGMRATSDGAISHLTTPTGAFAVRSVVNAAGLQAGEVATAAGDEPFRMWPRKGQFLVVDRELGRTVTKILAPVPSPGTRGVLAVPTTNGSLLLGPTAVDGEDPGDKSTDQATLEDVFARARRLLPDLRAEHVIKSFSGLRPATDHVYRVQRSARVVNLVHAAGIRSTGVSSSPAVAELVRDLLAEIGVKRAPRAPAHDLPRRPRIAELSSSAAVTLCAQDPAYRVLVCACEHVSAAEIRNALTGPIPARTIDGVRKRTRATGGRCQGAYCAAGVGFMLSVAHDLEPGLVPQTGPLSTWGVSACQP